jgi:manganese oxidase
VTLKDPLAKDHSAGHWVGTEFSRSIWYPDVELDNVFWHDHVDGIHTWGAGLVSQLVVEPRGSTYHDPRTGAEVRSGTFVDIRTPGSMAPGLVDGSFREQVLWTIDGNPVTDSTLNLRAVPWADRLSDNPDPSLLFSSYTHGDPNTPLPRAYAGDPFVFRTINVGPQMDTLSIDGHRFFTENRFQDATGKAAATPTNALAYGVSERFSLALDGGAGGPDRRAGDYMYFNGVGRRFKQGAWGLLRVLPPRRVGDLQPLPGTAVSDLPAPALPAPTGGRPPAAANAGDPCPAGVPERHLAVSAVDLPGGVEGRSAAFVPTADADAVRTGAKAPEPLAAHAAAGECVVVNFTNQRATQRASFHVAELARTLESSGINAGFNPEQTVAPAGTRTYRFYADTRKIGAATVSDFGAAESGAEGLYGAMVVHPQGAWFSNPVSGDAVNFGTAVDVHIAGTNGYRDFVAIMADDDPIISGDFMPYPEAVGGPALLNYNSTPRPDGSAAFSSRVNGEPTTPTLRAYGGDPTKVHFLVAPGSEQAHVASLGGQFWPIDPELAQSQQQTNQNITAFQALDAEIRGGAGGLMRAVGDFFYGDMRRPFTQAGIWGLMRVMSDASCPIRPLDGLSCTAQPSIIVDPPPLPRPGAPAPGETPGAPAAVPPGPAGPGGTSAPARPQVRGVVTGGTRSARGLRVRRRVTLSEMARRGLRMEMLVPADTRVVDLQLLRRSGRKLVPAVRGRVKIKRGGPIVLRWKPKASDLRKLRAGTYVLRVRVGATAKGLSRQSAQATFRFTGRLPRATTRRST